MSLGAGLVKEEPGRAATEDVTFKEEPELDEAEWVQNEAEYVPQLCVQQVCDQLEPACTKQEPLCAPPEVVGDLEPVYTELETVCFKDEPICVQQPVCVKEEPPWQDSVWSELNQELKYEDEVPVEPGPLPAGTPNVKGTKWDCFVRLERCVVPRGAALRFKRASRRRERVSQRLERARAAASRPGAAASRPGAPHATPTPPVARAHEREIAMKQLSGMLIKGIGKLTTHDNFYSCEICKKQYKNLASLTTHKVGHTKKIRSKITRSEKNTYFCEVCKAVLHDLDSLKVHALVHAKMTIPLYLCDICHREFATIHALRTHKRAHTHVRPFKCQFCKERFSRPIDLSRHLASRRAHTQRGKLTNFCKGCETKQAIKQLGVLLRTELGQTSENTDFCELCNTNN